MSRRLPRLLPLVAVAIAGVMAVNLLGGAKSVPQLFQGARAWAEGVAAPAPKAAAASPLPPHAAAAAPAASTAQICAPTAAEFADAAGLSPAELQVLQSLGQRRTELDSREAGMDVQVQLLNTAGQKLDAKAATMRDLITQMQALLGQADAQHEADVARMVKVYETMAPKDAAPALAIMSDEVRLPILAKMKERNLAAVLQKMTPAQARDVTEKLAQRTSQNAALDAARATAASVPPVRTGVPASAAPAAPPPARTAAATPPAAAPAARGATPAPATASPAGAAAQTKPG